MKFDFRKHLQVYNAIRWSLRHQVAIEFDAINNETIQNLLYILFKVCFSSNVKKTLSERWFAPVTVSSWQIFLSFEMNLKFPYIY